MARGTVGTCAVFLGLFTFIASAAGLKRAHPGLTLDRHGIACVLLLPACISWTWDGASSMSTDIGVAALHIVATLTFVRMIASEGEITRRELVRLMLVIGAGIVVKLSFTAFGAALLTVTGMELRRRRQLRARWLVLPSLALLALLIPWLVRGLILSGWPLYPVEVAGIDLDWAMPRAALRAEAREVIAWARAPGKPVEQVLADWRWLGPWLERILTTDRRRVVIPLVLGAVAGAFVMWRGEAVRRLRLAKALAPCVIALIAWFFSAPDPRFAAALFALVLALCGAEFLDLVRVHRVGQLVGGLVLSLCLIGGLANLAWRSSASWMLAARSGMTQDTGARPTKAWRTRFGLVLNVPASGVECGTAPLPCTPSRAPSLQLRSMNRLDTGFRVSPTATSGRRRADSGAFLR